MHELLGDDASGGLRNDEDIMAVAEKMEPNFSAGLLVWEDVWATKIKDAILASGGELWALERVPHEVVAGAVEWVAVNNQGRHDETQRSRIGRDGGPLAVDSLSEARDRVEN